MCFVFFGVRCLCVVFSLACHPTKRTGYHIDQVAWRHAHVAAAALAGRLHAGSHTGAPTLPASLPPPLAQVSPEDLERLEDRIAAINSMAQVQ